MLRILIKEFALAFTTYKFLNIGIIVRSLRWDNGMVLYSMAKRLITETVIKEAEALVYVKGHKKREKLYKSSNRTLWLILCKVYFKFDIYKPFTIALYSGTNKSKKLEEYLYKFICEICNVCTLRKSLATIKVDSSTSITIYISYICCIKNARYPWHRHYNNEFFNFTDINHHTRVFALIYEPCINMISYFVINPMHLTKTIKKKMNRLYNHSLLLHVAYHLLSTKIDNQFIEYATQYLNIFVTVAKDLYGKRFITIKNINCPLNLISAYCFESHLDKIKNILCNLHHTVSQFCHREYEKKFYVEKDVILPQKQEIIKILIKTFLK
ncbi:hypothetical protein ALC56_07112 [Trachymyrmex septentrionalis]|uniref:THAP domain-containing protein 9 n=1 Tax=Trachymyrmex septentrionalis TaxID=34720 RepID=A0A151JW45_9HYME|nr:hypothetical protein ALC56_07112 [Trachymyrmex septentrionalis]